MPGRKPGLHNQDTLKLWLDDLDETRAAVASVKDLMGQHDVNEMTIGYHTESLKALKKILQFAHHGVEQLKEARKKRGDYGVTVKSNGVPKKTGTTTRAQAKKGKGKEQSARRKPPENQSLAAPGV